MRLEAMAMQFPDVTGHPNRIPFEGVLTTVDEPSTRAPSGARGHRVILSSRAAKESLPSLLGMAIGFTPGYDGHDVRRKCGLITEADVVGRELRVRGHIYGRDFPEMVKRLDKETQDSMGMSYELAEAQIEDVHAAIWLVTKAMFTGAAVLLREKAAYKATSFRLRRNLCRDAGIAAVAMKRSTITEQKGYGALWK